jgi:hypothetical protein
MTMKKKTKKNLKKGIGKFIDFTDDVFKNGKKVTHKIYKYAKNKSK